MQFNLTKSGYFKLCINFIEKVLDELQEDEDVEMGLRFENIEVNADQILNDLGNIVEGDFNEPQPIENYHFPAEEVHLAGAGVTTNENVTFIEN